MDTDRIVAAILTLAALRGEKANTSDGSVIATYTRLLGQVRNVRPLA